MRSRRAVVTVLLALLPELCWRGAGGSQEWVVSGEARAQWGVLSVARWLRAAGCRCDGEEQAEEWAGSEGWVTACEWVAHHHTGVLRSSYHSLLASKTARTAAFDSWQAVSAGGSGGGSLGRASEEQARPQQFVRQRISGNSRDNINTQYILYWIVNILQSQYIVSYLWYLLNLLTLYSLQLFFMLSD